MLSVEPNHRSFREMRVRATVGAIRRLLFWLPIVAGFAGGAAAQTSTVTHSNPASITINDLDTATPYPSVIDVSGLRGRVAKVTLQLKGFNHPCPADLDIALVAPGGTWIVPMSNTGACQGVTDVDLQFADGAPALTDETVSDTYAPSSFSEVAPPPANLCLAGQTIRPDKLMSTPATAMAAFNGTVDADNGRWLLYVADCIESDSGNFSRGWSLTFTTVEDEVHGVPALSEWLLAVLSILLLGAGIVIARRAAGPTKPT